MWTSSLEAIPGWVKMPLFNGSTSWTTPPLNFFEDQAILDNDLKSIQSHQEDYKAKLERMLVRQQGVVDKMIKYLETVKNRRRELERHAGVPMLVPVPGLDLPRDLVTESLLMRVKTLRTESISYGPPRVDPGVLPFIPKFSVSVMLGEKMPEKGYRIGTPKRDTCKETVEIDMSSPQAQATFDTRAAYAAHVDEEALGSAAHRDGSSGESWVQDPRSGIWTMVRPGMRGGKSGPREDMGIQGVYSHSPGNRSGGSVRLGGVIALDVGDAVRIEDIRGVKTPHYDANPANLDDFILDLEDFAEEVVGELRLGSDARYASACRAFPNLSAPELKADLRDAIREKRIRTEEQCLDWLEQEEGVDTPTEGLMTCGQHRFFLQIDSCG